MAGQFIEEFFSNIDINDSFFDSLKNSYPGNHNSSGFVAWFNRKAVAKKKALIFKDDSGLGAFLSLKDEEEEIKLVDEVLPVKKRIKISTFKIAERFSGQRIGEGALGLILWEWQKSDAEEIYATLFEEQSELKGLLERFGFICSGKNLNGELVYYRSKLSVDFQDPFKSFPYISKDTSSISYIIIEDHYHDAIFAYSELQGVPNNSIFSSVNNGLSKVYIGNSPNSNHKIGQPVLIYRKFTGEGVRRYKSCVTSYAIITNIIKVKQNGTSLMSYDELKSNIGNKSVFDEAELRQKYKSNYNMIVEELLYYGYFGAGNNVNMDWLNKNGFWGGELGSYPTEYQLSIDDFKCILKKGKINESNVIVD